MYAKHRLAPRVVVFTAMIMLATGTSQAAQTHVMVFGMDGVRPDAMAVANTPNLDALIDNGTYSSNATASDLTFSGPGWTDLLSGVHRDQHGVATNGTADNPSEANPQFQIFSGSNQHNFPDLLAIANTANPALQTARFIGEWNPLHTTRSPAGSEYTFVGNDAQATANAVSYYSNAANDAHVGYLYFANPDFAGHASGFHPNAAGYTNQISATDAQIGSVVAAIQSRPNFASEDWLFIVGSDHGGVSNGGHSGNAPWSREVPLIVSGAAAMNQTLDYGAKNVDIVPTALAHLGIAAPANLVGHVVGLAASPKPTAGFGTNLIFNGDGEYDRGFTNHGMDQAVSGWEEFGDANFIAETSSRIGNQSATVLQYNTPGGFPLAGDPGSADRGENFISAGAASSTSEMTQRIDVSSLAAQIDADQVDFEASAYLGGFSSQNDKADFAAHFLAADGTTQLGSILLAGPNAAGRGNVTGLFEQNASGDLITGTRFIEFVLSTNGNDGYADNLSFTLSAVPEPSTFVLAALGILGLLGFGRRRKRG
jgi:arylsulfatase A-like enzyme